MLDRHRKAFALPELAATIAITAIVCSLLIVLSPRSRQMAWQAGSIANLHEFATVTASYAADNADQFWSYTWRAHVPLPSQYPDLQLPQPDALNAATAQAVDILHRRSGGYSDSIHQRLGAPHQQLTLGLSGLSGNAAPHALHGFSG